MLPLYSILEPWLLPPGLNFLLALVGLGLYFFKPKAGKTLFFLSFISLWVCSAPIFAYNLLEILQNEYPILNLNTLAQIPARGAIVVLGGGNSVYVEQDNKLALDERTLNRVRYAAYLHKKTNLPLIVSGGSTNGVQETEASLMSTSLRDNFDIPSVIKEDKSNTTEEESRFLASLLRQQHFEVVYLVTNAWHMPRSVYSLKQEGIAVIPAPMGYEVYDHNYTILSYLPNVQALTATSTAIHEFIGLLWYHLYY